MFSIFDYESLNLDLSIGTVLEIKAGHIIPCNMVMVNVSLKLEILCNMRKPMINFGVYKGPIIPI